MRRFEDALFGSKDYLAADSLSRIIESCPKLSTSDYWGLAYSKRCVGKWDDGLRLADKGLARAENQRDSILIYREYIELQIGAGRTYSAIQKCKEAIKFISINLRENYNFNYQLGDLYYDALEFGSALKHHRKALEISYTLNDSSMIRWAASEICFDYTKLGLIQTAFDFNLHYELKLDSMINAEKRILFGK
ncbi:MAG: hypothetical protein SH856_12045 [Flavobacteriales bacterium]|nr:hypothetical protein [Flavobacteriales bacterium]